MSPSAHFFLRALSLLVALGLATPAYAHIGLVVGEPFGSFGTMMPAGHAGIYLDRLCADTPTHLRLCQAGEAGVVLSRYHDLRSQRIDWMAVPARTFFYGVNDTYRDPPGFVTPSLEAELREVYRQDHLMAVAPDHVDKHGVDHPPAYGDWQEAIGAAFDRRLFIYVSDTTPAQDLLLLEYLNADANSRRYSLFHANCADFAADLLNLVYPGVFHRNVADFHMMSPKQLSRLMETYSLTHPETNLAVYEIPQLPGSLRRSRPIRGAAETLLTTKRYLATLLVIQPEAVLASWIVYEKKGKWTPLLQPTLLAPEDWQPKPSLEQANALVTPVPISAGQPVILLPQSVPQSLPTQSASAQRNKD